jgi:hypothetical protein
MEAQDRPHGAPQRPNRQRVSNEAAAEFIRRHIAEHPKASYTSALKAFRESGYAFEQSRFRDVFRQVQQEPRGS